VLRLWVVGVLLLVLVVVTSAVVTVQAQEGDDPEIQMGLVTGGSATMRGGNYALRGSTGLLGGTELRGGDYAMVGAVTYGGPSYLSHLPLIISSD
jgi:hypothetical protein